MSLNAFCSLNVCDAVKSASSKYRMHRVFPDTHYVIRNHRPAFYPEANVLSSSRANSSPSFSNLNPSFYMLLISSQSLRHISLLVKFCMFFTILLKVRLSPFKKICLICFFESPSKIMKNAFCFILKVLFVLKIFVFL